MKEEVTECLRDALIVERVRQLVPEQQMYDRERIETDSSYDARVAKRLLAGHQNASVAIVTRGAMTRLGLRMVCSSCVVFYRKSSHRRSVQQCFVLPKQI